MIVERSIEIETMDDDEGEYNAMNTFSARSQFRQIAGSEKAAAQAVPIIGAAGGAILNWLFISHYQQMAKGHFTIRRLERLYPSQLVEARYRAL